MRMVLLLQCRRFKFFLGASLILTILGSHNVHLCFFFLWYSLTLLSEDFTVLWVGDLLPVKKIIQESHSSCRAKTILEKDNPVTWTMWWKIVIPWFFILRLIGDAGCPQIMPIKSTTPHQLRCLAFRRKRLSVTLCNFFYDSNLLSLAGIFVTQLAIWIFWFSNYNFKVLTNFISSNTIWHAFVSIPVMCHY